MEDAPNKILRKRWMWVSVGSNLSLLFFFKYLDFFNESIRGALGLISINYPVPTFNILLPVGISFYTFQSLSYTLDVYWKRIKAERHYGIFAVYVCFFPQLVAGPIERAGALLPQFKIEHKFDLERVVSGCKLIVWGLFKKLIIADVLGNYVNIIFSNPYQYNGLVCFLGTAFFGYQLYIDLFAYADIAIGSARIIGFDLMSNFNRPYQATNIADFWKGWHISVTSWIFDYLYKPLRRITKSWNVTIILMFTIIGFWHGAAWGFVVEGFIHGCTYVFADGTKKIRSNIWKHTHIESLPRLNTILAQIAVLSGLFLPTLFFRVNNIGDGIYMLKKIVSDAFQLNFTLNLTFKTPHLLCLFIGFFIFTYVQMLKNYDPKNPFMGINNVVNKWIFYLVILFMLILFADQPKQDFIYFQF